ncbi:hypothetical protein AAMO2058_001376800 [Amorphochlora amoebiformis]
MGLNRTACFRWILALAVAFWPIGFLADHEPFRPERARLVDYRGGRYLFRTNQPTNSSTFLYDDLLSVFRSLTLNSSGVPPIPLGKEVYIVDICLLNVATESPDIQIEKEFFIRNPSKGRFVNYPILGSLIPPGWYPSVIRSVLAKYLDRWSYDKLPSFIQTIFHLMTSDNISAPADATVVILIHCEAGTDRTGEVSGSYMQAHLGLSYSEALDIDNHIQKREIAPMSRNGLQWFCYYMQTMDSGRDCD